MPSNSLSSLTTWRAYQRYVDAREQLPGHTLVDNSNPNCVAYAGVCIGHRGPPGGGGNSRVMPTSLAAEWTALVDHFEHHAKLVDRFRAADRDAVLCMWRSQTNEGGNPLSEFEREALIERHCELFGTWPD